MFKNETHNHPTEIEPFGGAATCLGGAIRDPLSGRSYVYQAMRVTGAGDPTVPLSRPCTASCPSASCAHRCCRLLLLRQPDRPGYRPGARDLSPGLCRQAHGDRRGRRRSSAGERHPRSTRAGRHRHPARRRAPAATAAAVQPAPPRATPPNRWTPAAQRCRRATRPKSARSSVCSATRRSPA